MELRTRPYDHPDSTKLIDELQQEYLVRYRDVDVTPVNPAQFLPPHGLFVVGYLDTEPVTCGGWRTHDGEEPEFRDGDAEIKRMFVVPWARGKGLARLLLAELEQRAMAAGRLRIVLETGTQQPEAIALYLSSGYERIANFGVYREDPLSRCYGKVLTGSAADGASG